MATVNYTLRLEESDKKQAKVKITREEKARSLQALTGILAGHEVDLDAEREERIFITDNGNFSE